MSIHFLADLHLSSPTGEFSQKLIAYLQTTAKQAEAVYVLGDLFDVWIGDDGSIPQHQAVVNAFGQLAATGVPLYFIRGNRDFAVGREFVKQTGMIILPDPYKINLYGQPTLLSHGDLFCTDDVKHQKFRAKYMNPKWRKHRLWLPLWLRQGIADWARQKSQRNKQAKPRHIMDVNQQTVERIMRDQGVLQLIHGHTHRPDVHHFEVLGSPAQRIVLPDWRPNKMGVMIFSQTGYSTHWLT